MTGAMAGPVMFVVAFAALLTWGAFERRRVPWYWPSEEPAEWRAFRERLEMVVATIGEAFMPTMRALGVVAAHAVEAFTAFGRALSDAHRRED